MQNVILYCFVVHTFCLGCVFKVILSKKCVINITFAICSYKMGSITVTQNDMKTKDKSLCGLRFCNSYCFSRTYCWLKTLKNRLNCPYETKCNLAIEK